MKKKSRKSVGSEWELPTEEEVEIARVLLTELPILRLKSDLIERPYISFTWGVMKKRSVLDSISESFAQQKKSPTSPLCIVSSGSSGSDGCDKGKAPMYGPNVLKRKATYDLSDSISESFAQQKKSPTRPLCFVSNGGSNESDGDYKGKAPMYGPNVLKRKECFVPSSSSSESDRCDKGKAPMYGPNVLKRKATDDLMEIIHNRLQQEKDIYMKQLKCMESLDEELTYKTLEGKKEGKKISYPSNMVDYHTWNSSMKTPDQVVVDPTQVASCSTNTNDGSIFGLFNRIHPRVKTHVETYDFMGSSQPLDQSRCMVMDTDLKVRAAAEARKRRKLVLKEKRKLSNVGHETINIG